MTVIIKKAVVTAVVTAVAAAVLVGLSLGPASATTITGGPNFAAASTNSKLTSGSTTLSCNSSTANGKMTATSGTPTFRAGEIDNISWSGCTWSGYAATITANALPWALWVTGTTSGSGVTPGEIRGVNATISIPSPGCTIQVTGTAPATFTNSSQDLQFTGGSLSTAGSGFCPGLGTTGSMSGDYAVSGTDANGNSSPITIS